MRSIEDSRPQPVEMSSAVPLIGNLFYWIVDSLSHALSCVYSFSKNGENPFFMVRKTVVDHVPWSLLFKFVLNSYLGHTERFLNVEHTMKHKQPWNKNNKYNSHWNVWLEDKRTQNISESSESSLGHPVLIGSAHVSKWVDILTKWTPLREMGEIPEPSQSWTKPSTLSRQSTRSKLTHEITEQAQPNASWRALTIRVDCANTLCPLSFLSLSSIYFHRSPEKAQWWNISYSTPSRVTYFCQDFTSVELTGLLLGKLPSCKLSQDGCAS